MATASVATIQVDSTDRNESEMILAARKGDIDAFNQLVLRYQDRIYNLAVRILGDTDAAEDITQNTFLTAYLNLPRFRNGSFRSWLYRIATTPVMTYSGSTNGIR
jgi:RNA polymerase sigma-70 factor (ECF subfamily)